MGFAAALLRRHGAVYVADPFYRLAWLAGPLMAAVFVTSRLIVAAPTSTPGATGVSAIGLNLPFAHNVVSPQSLSSRARTGDFEAETELRREANTGSVAAQGAMAELYDPHLNPAHANAGRTLEAIEWYRRVAQKGVIQAERNLGVLMLGSPGVPPNETEARRWFDAIAPIDLLAARHLASLYLNGRGGNRDIDAGYRLLRMAADRGDVISDTWLGTQYENGSDNIPKNPAEAVRLFHLAALQGNAVAERKLAAHLDTGDGVATDAAAARRWYTLAAAGGDGQAQSHLAQIDPVAEFQTPKWGAVTRPIDVDAGQDVTAERERCIAFRVRDEADKMAATLPSTFDEQKKQSGLLLPLTPRDPRVRYARAAAFYDADKDDLARVNLECAIDDPATLSRYPAMTPYLFALLARIDVDENDRLDAAKVIAPVCVSNNPGVRKLDDDIGLCP